MRTAELDLIGTVRNFSRGTLTNKSVAFMNSLKPTLHLGDSEKTVLFSKNYDCWVHNQECLMKIDGDRRLYISTDTGKVDKLIKLPAVKVIILSIYIM